MGIRKICIILFAILFSTLSYAYAQTSKNDAEFIRKLIEHGYCDLADEMFDRLSKDSSVPDNVKAAIPLLKSENLIKKSEKETDAAKAKVFMQTALEQIKEYIKGNPPADELINAKISMAMLLLRMAHSTAETKKTEQAPEKLTAINQEVDKLFSEAIGKLNELISDLGLAEDPDKARPNLIYSNSQLVRAKYEYAINTSPEKKEAALDAAIKFIVEEFQFTFANEIEGFESGVYGGLCYKEKADLKQDPAEKEKCFTEAEKQFNYSISLKDAYTAQNVPLDDYAIDIISRGYLFKAQMFNQRKQGKKAIEIVDELLKLSPKINVTPFGLEAQLEKAKAFGQLKNYQQGITLLNKIIELVNGEGRFAEKAREMIPEFASKAGGGSPDQMIATVDWRMTRERYYDAIADLRKLILLLPTKNAAEREKYMPIAYYKLGQCYFAMGRLYEASFLFEYVFTFYPDEKTNKLAPEAAFQAVRCLFAEFTDNEDPVDQNKYMEYMKVIVDKYPDHPVAGNTKYVYGEQMERKNELQKAVELYKAVPETAEAYETALVQAASCLYRLGFRTWEKNKADAKNYFIDAESILKKVIQRFNDQKIDPTDTDKIASRDRLRFLAYNQLSSLYLHEAINKPQELMQAVLEAEKLAKDPTEQIKISLIKIKALVATEKIEEAEALFRQILEKESDPPPETVDICYLVAASFDIAASKLEKDKNTLKKANSYYLKAGQYYQKWLKFTAQLSIAEMQSISDRLYVIGIKTNELPESIDLFVEMPNKTLANQDFLAQAGLLYTKVLAGGKLTNKEDVFKITLKLARCYGFLGVWQEAKKYYEDIIKLKQLTDANGKVDPKIVTKEPGLLTIYQELGFVYRELARTTQHTLYGNALSVFSNICTSTAPQSKAWWTGKYYTFMMFFERGDEGDLNQVDIGLDNLQRNFPQFDDDKYGMKTKFLELKKTVKEKMPAKK